MKKILLVCAAIVGLSSSAFASCEKEFDALSKAISGPVAMADGHRAAMMRMAVKGYDSCMAGDMKDFESVRDMLMKQVRESLGGK